MSCEQEHTHSHSHGDGGNGGGHSHSHGPGDHVAPIPTSSAQSLLSKIDIPHVTGLNLENTNEELGKIFRKPEDKYKLKPVIKSDSDAQVIINIPFLNASAKLFSLILRTNGDRHCPKTIKLFKNDNQIDFDNVESKKPAFVIDHPRIGVLYNDDEDDNEEYEEEEELPEESETENDFVEHFLPRHLFTGVQLLTVFIQDIYAYDRQAQAYDTMTGDEVGVSQLHYIDLRGEFSELSRDPVITLYESAANPADHKNLTAAESMNHYQL